MTRSELREHIFRIVFRAEFHPEEEFEEQIEFYTEHMDAAEKDIAYIQAKSKRIFARLTQLDEEINAITTGWKVERMGKVDLAIIRLALFEMKDDDEIPVGVAINEAVELAKRYGTDDSASFINGVLAKLA